MEMTLTQLAKKLGFAPEYPGVELAIGGKICEWEKLLLGVLGIILALVALAGHFEDLYLFTFKGLEGVLVTVGEPDLYFFCERLRFAYRSDSVGGFYA